MNSKREEDKRWVIPSLDCRLPQPPSVKNREIIRYWMIEQTLTSGEVLNFYVKAKTQYDALEKAEGFKHLSTLPRFKKDKLILLD